MDVDQTFTIVRIKRKRNEEHLDALVLDSGTRKKKSRTTGVPSAQEVFQFAQTIEHDSWDERRKELKDHISRLTRNPVTPSPSPSTSASSSVLNPRPAAQAEERRYTIVKPPDEPALKPRYPTSPPKVHSARVLAERRNDFSMYDAVLDRPAASPTDKELESFLPMLNDYLRLQDLPAPSLDPSSSDSGDYVYDVFYRRVGGYNPAEYTGNVATLSGLPPQGDNDSDYSDEEIPDEADEDSNDEDYYKNDYPEDEDSDSDELHHYSDSSDEYAYYDNASDHEWR